MNNYCTSAPPESLWICGRECPIHSDFLIWIRVLRLIRGLDSTGDELAAKNNAAVINDICDTVFVSPSDVANMPADEILKAVETFSHGYPQERSTSGNDSDEGDNLPTVSFEYDINLIAIAIRNQSGIDLSYSRKKPFHWWLFLLEFSALEDHHAIVKVINARAYKGDDKHLIALRERERIPDEFLKTRTEERQDEAFDRYFT